MSTTALSAPMPAGPVVVNPPHTRSFTLEAPAVVFCGCGCGEAAPIALKTDARCGWVKGQPKKFINGHAGRLQTQVKAGTLAIAHPVELAPGMREITGDDIVRLRAMDDLDAATIYDQRCRALDVFERRSFAEKGLIGLEMEERKLWTKLADPTTQVYFHSYDAWLASAMPYSRSSMYDAKATMKSLRMVPVADVLEMPRCNAKQLQNLSTAVQKNPEVIEAAKQMPERKFTEFIQQHHPSQAHEKRAPIVMKPTESARKAMDTALEAAMWVFEVERREEAFEAMAASWLDAQCDREGYEQMTNRMAFAEATKGKRRAG